MSVRINILLYKVVVKFQEKICKNEDSITFGIYVKDDENGTLKVNGPMRDVNLSARKSNLLQDLTTKS